MTIGWNFLCQRTKHALHNKPPENRLTLQKVLSIATAYLADQGNYALREPYNVSIESDNSEWIWHICASVNTRGGNDHMHVSDATGQVVKTWATPM